MERSLKSPGDNSGYGLHIIVDHGFGYKDALWSLAEKVTSRSDKK